MVSYNNTNKKLLNFSSSETIADSRSGIDILRGSYLPTPVTQRGCMSAAVKRYRYLRKLLSFKQMDFEFALWQMTYLFINPQKVYRNFQYRKETKSQFARDDPAFLVLLSACLFISSVGFTIVLKLGVTSALKLLIYFVFVDCILFGIIVATIFWLVTNKYLIKPNCKNQDVEWGYAFDVHLNAFCPTLIISHIVQLFFYNVLTNSGSFFARFFGNTIWIIAFSYYIYITFLGYRNLKILKDTPIFEVLFILLFTIYFVSLVVGWNISISVMDFYHYRVL